MRHCPRCGATVLPGESFCQLCGLAQPGPSRPRLPLRRAALVALGAIVVVAGVMLAYGWQEAPPATVPVDLRAADEILAGNLPGVRLVGTWDYPEGTMEELEGLDSGGHRLVVYRDAASGTVRGFNVALPPASRVALSQARARRIAGELASRAPFFDDPTLKLEEARLVDHGPGTERYYFFSWVARDPRTQAVLLRAIQVAVHPQTGGIISYLSRDGGPVKIATEPAVTREAAARAAREKAAELLAGPRVVEQVLHVSLDYGGQKLVWLVVLEDAEPGDLASRVYVELDAQTGLVLRTDR